MDLHRRKLWGDRTVWLFVVAATAVVVREALVRGGDLRYYVMWGWIAIVAFLLFVSELRIGRRKPRGGPRSMFAGTAAYVGADVAEDAATGNGSGGRDGRKSKEPTVPGVLELAPAGVRWTSSRETAGVREKLIGWRELHGWRLNGVLPLIGRASGYLSVRRDDGSAELFHIHGVRRWRKALRKGAVEGPTMLRPSWLPDEPAPGFPLLLAGIIRPPRGAAGAGGFADTATVVPDPPPRASTPVSPQPQPEAPPPRAPVPEPQPVAPAPQAPVPGPVAGPPQARIPGQVAGPPQAPIPEPVAGPPPAPVPAPPPPAVRDEPAAPPQPDPLEPVIGLECHVELSTNSKVFCGCPTEFGAEPNTQICPVCTGQPGTLPVLNEKAVEYAMRIGLALNCTIAPESIFHRKNYFYPDMPKNFQISQYDVPLASAGYLDVEVDGHTRRIGIHRVHLEEDTGKTTHSGGTGRIAESASAKVDYNRAGVPLVEIVSEPDIRTPEEARVFLSELRALLETIGVSDVRMEQGSLRCDANVSVRPSGSDRLGTKAEVKNMNSIRSVQRALDHEIRRQVELVSSGQSVAQETRHFDEATGTTSTLRSKEYAFDYRYFPEPDLVPLAPDGAWVDRVRDGLPELPAQRRRRLSEAHGLSDIDARTITSSKGLADAYEAAAAAYGGDPKSMARWYLGELSAIANDKGAEPHEAGVSPQQVVELQQLVDSGQVSISIAKGKVLRRVVETGTSPHDVVAEQGLAQISESSELAAVVEEVISSNPDIVEQIRNGKTGAINALKGQVMKRTQGRANPEVVGNLLAERLASS